MDAEEIVAEYNTLVLRAHKIVSSAPYWHFVHNEDYAKIDIDGETVTFTDFDLHSSYYDSVTVESESVTFPLSLLLMTDADLDKWKVQKMEEYHVEQAARDAKSREIAAHKERLIYESLKRKFGDDV